MRIISFSRMWDKLNGDIFTTFRYPRVDRDWAIGEIVQVYFKNRSPQRTRLGTAEIISKEVRELDPCFTDGRLFKPSGIPLVADEEAIADGFDGRASMVVYMEKTYGLDYISRMNKLTLVWAEQLRQ